MTSAPGGGSPNAPARGGNRSMPLRKATNYNAKKAPTAKKSGKGKAVAKKKK